MGTINRRDDTIAAFSSRGPTAVDAFAKPDLVAPGVGIESLSDPNSAFYSTMSAYLLAGTLPTSYLPYLSLSGTSMSTPVVSGTVALMLQANPSLTPNLVKALMMYSAQDLAGFNAFEQGAGQVNIEGAIRLAKLVRTDLSSSTSAGSGLLTGSAPTAQSTIAGYTFTWSQGVILDQSYATGTALITKYQKIYGLGERFSPHRP